MGDKSKEKRFLLRLDDELYNKIEAAAQRANRSVNAHINSILRASAGQNTFEHRQIVGQVLRGNQLNTENGLVEVSGIYYRFLIDNNEDVEPDVNYTVLESNGNILTLRRL
ncbi:toxin-antitoxin system HicB family antitoxin [Furfurilactobacillus siliginis]|uniref:Arc-like DNA binding domain-containing protein n=1 Tax=Furfurilactobacillus siliginis TaxID=348151 RepID=A0A510VQ39_9LACO|nr:toxin-antitoxin system HicB family antitoxin [Furfurilactobacillus siliginis]GEK29053.1 hypothetical protein LSI01_13640 [Furfurilactobacillus siliginis]